ncbi:uncharacterized protein LOC110710621 [Chenopodium quinoa]|uniref:uncharacterized protein LOC110710621 n=1 Tax=Chenopodium quinoa TaxID=63459 RepID=UPI000B76E04E|nr:uncharacterized protein LOC110710621 [Chenopodium quinoa]
MLCIKKLNEEAFKYLNDIPPAHWSRHAFTSSCKSGMLLNNCCESFNNVLREARCKPILQLMEWIRRYVLARCFAKKEGLKIFEGEIMPSVVKMVHRGLQESGSMRINQADLNEFEVDHGDDTFVVNLETQTCGCYRWTLMGIPCWHALACIQLKRLNYEHFIHPAYHVITYAKAYAPSFKAMPGQSQWEVTPYPKPLPPSHRKMPGRPSKKKRVREQGEDQERRNVKRAKKKNRCSRCGGLGHYKTKCNNPVQQVVPKPKGRKQVGVGQRSSESVAGVSAAGATASYATGTSDAAAAGASASSPPGRRRKSVARKGGSQKKKRSTSANQVHISICHGDAPPLTQSQDPPAMGS